MFIVIQSMYTPNVTARSLKMYDLLIFNIFFVFHHGFPRGSMVRLYCDIDANPPANIQWFRVDSKHNSDQLLPLKSSPILMVNAGFNSNSEIYACLASNKLGSIRKTFSINTWSQPKLFDVSNKKVQINSGQDVELRCEASGHPPPEFIWSKERKEINTENLDFNSNLLISDDKMTLSILNIQVSDGGNYQCTAKNIGGETSKSFNVEVFSKPVIARDMPINMTVVEGQSLNFPCRVLSGHPKPKI